MPIGRFMSILCAPNRPPALHSASWSGARREDGQRIRVPLVADVPHPVALRPVLAVRPVASSVWIGRSARRDRQHSMREAVAKRLPGAVRDRLRMRLVRDVEDHPAAVDPADIGAVRLCPRGSSGECMRMPASNGDTRGGGGAVSPTRVPGNHQRPVSCGCAGSRDIDDHQELVVSFGSCGAKSARAGRKIGIVPIDEPDKMHAARMRPRSVEMRQFLRCAGSAIS